MHRKCICFLQKCSEPGRGDRNLRAASRTPLNHTLLNHSMSSRHLRSGPDSLIMSLHESRTWFVCTILLNIRDHGACRYNALCSLHGTHADGTASCRTIDGDVRFILQMLGESAGAARRAFATHGSALMAQHASCRARGSGRMTKQSENHLSRCVQQVFVLPYVLLLSWKASVCKRSWRKVPGMSRSTDAEVKTRAVQC